MLKKFRMMLAGAIAAVVVSVEVMSDGCSKQKFRQRQI